MNEAAEERPVWAWIDLEALRHNARRARACAAGRVVIGVIKADAYGHGAVDVARALLAEGIPRLAVVSVAEGAELRRAGIVAPILLMGGLDEAAATERALKWGLTPVLHDQRGFELARAGARSDAPLSVEVEVDTGMHRMGVAPSEVDALLAQVAATPQLSLSGIFTHLATADEADPSNSHRQIEAFEKIVAAQPADGASRPDVHISNSGGLLRLNEIERPDRGFLTQAVRPGLMLYGVSPFTDERGEPRVGMGAEALDLEPVMTLAAQVVATRRVRKGEAVGYGGAWRAPRETTVATLPLGYADGIPRSVLGRAEVHLAGAMRPIVGRVSMDYIGVEVAEGDVQVGDIATVFGRTPQGERIPVERIAAQAGTIGYELLTSVGSRVPRRVGEGLPPGRDFGDFDRAV
ncbi:MAG: alanine racemase [Myxococcota bacterium]